MDNISVASSYRHRYLPCLFIVMISAMCASCSTYRAYSGPAAPCYQIAVLRLPATGWALIVGIDGRPFYVGVGGSVELLPGEHAITFTYNIGGMSKANPFTTKAFFQAGKTYKAYARDSLPAYKEPGQQYSGTWWIVISEGKYDDACIKEKEDNCNKECAELSRKGQLKIGITLDDCFKALCK